jgi:hypothetical protein
MLQTNISPPNDDFTETFLRDDPRRIIFERILGDEILKSKILTPLLSIESDKQRIYEFNKQYKRLVVILKDESISDYKSAFLGERSASAAPPTPKHRSRPEAKKIPEYTYKNIKDVLGALSDFKIYIGEMRRLDYGPSINILNLSQKELTLYLKYLPNDSLWVKEIMEREDLYGLILININKLEDMIINADSRQVEYITLHNSIKNTDPSVTNLSDILKVYTYQKQNTEKKTIDTINGMINKLNSFGESNGTVYGSIRISNSIHLIETLLNDKYLQFLMNVEARLHHVLKENIETNLKSK